MANRIVAMFVSVFAVAALAACGVQKSDKNLSSEQLSQDGDYTNVIVILIDDLSHYGMSIYGAPILRSVGGHFPDARISTPNIDDLARTGFLAKYAYTHPLCEPSRIALLTGRGNERNYVQHRAQFHADIMFSDVFQREGYVTGLFGKWKQSRGTKEIPAKDYLTKFGFDEYTAFDLREQGQRFMNPNLVINGEIVDYTGSDDVDPETGRRWYGPDIFNRHALDFIDRHQDKPFMMYYPMALVHDDHKPTPDTQPHSDFDNFHEGTFYETRGQWTLVDGQMVLNDALEQGPDWTGQVLDDEKYMLDMLEYTDKLIGRIVQKLDETGIREKTLIVVMGDNGTKEIFSHVFENGEIYPGRKGGTADNGTHVGLILNQPGKIPAQQKSVRTYNGMVFVTDIFATIADAAGIEIPDHISEDSLSFWPQAIEQSNTPPRDHIYSWYIGNARYDDLTNRHREAAVFNTNFKLYGPSIDFPEGRFFDLRTDLFEKQGDRVAEHRFGVKRYSGLDVSQLSAEQKKAYEEMKLILERHEYVPVEGVQLHSEETELKVGQKIQMEGNVLPENATRKGVIWLSDNPEILDIDKFGETTALSVGDVQVKLYSWEKAAPTALDQSSSFEYESVHKTLSIRVIP